MTKIIQWYPGHMAKAKKNIAEDIKAVDLSIIVLDARVPLSCYNYDFDSILSVKPRLIVLNKEDLADKAMTSQWMKYFKSKGMSVVIMNASKKQGKEQLLREAEKLAKPVLDKLVEKGRLRRPVRALVVGTPNTGKSTLINALVPKASVKAANRPGVTRGRQWVRISDRIELLDTPGVLVPKFENQEIAKKLAFCGSIPADLLDTEDIGMELIAWFMKNKPENLMERYKLQELGNDSYEVLLQIGKARGQVMAGGKIREAETAMLVLKDFRSGNLGRITLDWLPKNQEEVKTENNKETEETAAKVEE